MGCTASTSSVDAVSASVGENVNDKRRRHRPAGLPKVAGPSTAFERASSADYGDNSSTTSSELSRPPTPFSRPLTARVAQRPRTTTIFERESDQKRQERQQQQQQQMHNGGMKKSSSMLTVNSSTMTPERRSKSRLGGDDAGLGFDEAMPARKLSRQLTATDQDEIIKLKQFLREKGL